MKKLALWVRCLFTKHQWDFETVLPCRDFGGAVARFRCPRCGRPKYER